VFADQGLHAASMADVAAQAGVAVGTLYNHFSDRDALLGALLESRRRQVMARLDAALEAGREAPFDAQLGAVFRVLLSHLEEHRAFLRIALQGEHGGLKKPNATGQAIEARFAQLVRRGLEQGALAARSEALYVMVLMGIMRAMLMRVLHDGPGAVALPPVDDVVELFMSGARG